MLGWDDMGLQLDLPTGPFSCLEAVTTVSKQFRAPGSRNGRVVVDAAQLPRRIKLAVRSEGTFEYGQTSQSTQTATPFGAHVSL